MGACCSSSLDRGPVERAGSVIYWYAADVRRASSSRLLPNADRSRPRPPTTSAPAPPQPPPLWVAAAVHVSPRYVATLFAFQAILSFCNRMGTTDTYVRWIPFHSPHPAGPLLLLPLQLAARHRDAAAVAAMAASSGGHAGGLAIPPAPPPVGGGNGSGSNNKRAGGGGGSSKKGGGGGGGSAKSTGQVAGFTCFACRVAKGKGLTAQILWFGVTSSDWPRSPAGCQCGPFNAERHRDAWLPCGCLTFDV